MPIKSSPFDLEFSKKYQSLKKSQKEIQQQINPLISDAKGNLQQINTLLAKRKVYDDAIIKFLQTETQKYCEQYAKKMSDMSLKIISTFLPDTALNFNKLSIKEKLDFGQTFINHIAEQFKIPPNKLVFKDDMPDVKGAEYDFKTGNININKKQNIKMQYFIGIILHEFTHYLYTKHPEHSPVGEQKTFAVMENYITDFPNGLQTKADFTEYKQRPFELPAYYIQDYLKKHKFEKTLLLHIKTLRQSMDSKHL